MTAGEKSPAVLFSFGRKAVRLTENRKSYVTLIASFFTCHKLSPRIFSVADCCFNNFYSTVIICVNVFSVLIVKL